MGTTEYPVGSTVTLRYDPANAEYSLLEADPGYLCAILTIACLVLIALSAVPVIMIITLGKAHKEYNVPVHHPRKIRMARKK